MERVIQILNEYEKSIGIPSNNQPGTEQELQQYLSWDRQVLEKFSEKECLTIAYRLGQFSTYIQREMNREDARHAWASAELTDIISPHLKEYDKFTKYDNKVSLIALENTYVKKLLDVTRYAELRVKRLSFLATSIKNLADLMVALSKTNKIYYNKHENSVESTV